MTIIGLPIISIDISSEGRALPSPGTAHLDSIFEIPLRRNGGEP